LSERKKSKIHNNMLLTTCAIPLQKHKGKGKENKKYVPKDLMVTYLRVVKRIRSILDSSIMAPKPYKF
jgi:hypothetical protein